MRITIANELTISHAPGNFLKAKSLFTGRWRKKKTGMKATRK
jgi:hypothetical protein